VGGERRETRAGERTTTASIGDEKKIQERPTRTVAALWKNAEFAKS
jgi:hypothetical protein